MYDSSHVDSSQLFQLGLDPDHTFYDLNLAGARGWPPDPGQVAQAENALPMLPPDYQLPDMAMPSLKPYDLTQPGITFMPEFAPDSTLPDLDTYSHPYNVDIISAQGIESAPEYARDMPTQQEITASLAPYSVANDALLASPKASDRSHLGDGEEVPFGLGFPTLDVRHEVTDVDPLLPDLQNPELMPEVQMPGDERPGELDPQALELLHADEHFQQTAAKRYPTSHMDARGMNDTRARHMALLTDGLKDA